LATLHLLCGLPASGKTTLAKQLERRRSALRLSPDEWIARPYGPDVQHRDPPTFDNARGRVETLQRELAERALLLGLDVILENGFWARAERDEYRAWAHGLGARVELHFLDVPRDELWARLSSRNAPPPGTFRVQKHELDLWLSHFEAPTAVELSDNRA